MDIEQAKTEINAMIFPEVQEGDIATHGDFQFIYTDGEWVEYEG